MPRREVPTPLTVLLCAVAALALATTAGCKSSGRDDSGGGASLTILRPERLAVHPLTRFGVDAEDRPVIVCHFELRDAFSQPVRALGIARVELFRPGSEFADGSQIQDLIWRTDLSTPQENARHFDGLVTRTYTLSLGGLPEWLLDWRTDVGNAGAVSPTIRVTFFRGEESAEGQLSDVFRLSR
jgi:hypothetical protein